MLTRPATTRAAVYYGPEDIRIETRAVRAPEPGEVLVRIRACGLCAGETMAWYMARKAPAGLGHEPSAEVVAAGEGAGPEGAAFAPGERVFVHHHAPCMACRACRRGHHVHCATFRRTRLDPGALSEFALVPAEVVREDLLALPPAVSDEAAVFIEPLACVVKALRRVRLRQEDHVAVVGLGVMGLLHVMLARALGAGRIVGIDLRPERLPPALAAGADLVLEAGADASGADLPGRVREVTDGGADVVAVMPAALPAIESGFRCAAPGGRLLLFAPLPPESPWSLPVHDLYFDEIEVIPSYSAGPADTREALGHIENGLPVETLISHRLSLHEAAEGYRLVAGGRALKVVVTP